MGPEQSIWIYTYIKEIVIALIGLAGALGTAILAYKANKLTRELDQAHAHIARRGRNTLFSDMAAAWEHIRERINELEDTTRADRFLLLGSFNGYLTPKWATAYVQIRQGEQDVYVYQDYKIDDDYRYRLSYIKEHDYAVWPVEHMPESEIRRIYTREGVTETFWYYISKRSVDNSDIWEITFFSISTHEEGGFTDSDIQKFISFGNELRALERRISGEDNDTK